MSFFSYNSNVKELLVNVQSVLLIQKFVLNSSSVLLIYVACSVTVLCSLGHFKY